MDDGGLAPRNPGSTMLRRVSSMAPRLTGVAGGTAHSIIRGRYALARASSSKDVAALQGSAAPLLRSF